MLSMLVAISCSGGSGGGTGPTDEGSTPAPMMTATRPEAPRVTDGRGNTLVAIGTVAGETWYCEHGGLVGESDHFSWPAGDPEPRPLTRREALRRLWGQTALGPHLDGAAIGNVRVTTVAGIRDGMDDVLDLTADAMLVTFPEVREGTVRVSLLVHDPERPRHRGAGEVRWVFLPDGWRTANSEICSSALTGEVAPGSGG